ncbi:MAG: hypothetical protein EBZ22_09385, partial [Flavobacteriia bacterium]|nr:hypothetical protein [Flavobacteriia bacterium]
MDQKSGERLAIFDLGTNTFNLLVRDTDGTTLADLATAGRRAVLRIAEVNATGGISKLEILDPGFGYEYNYDEGAENNPFTRWDISVPTIHTVRGAGDVAFVATTSEVLRVERGAVTARADV